jgi:hypothetical protein
MCGLLLINTPKGISGAIALRQTMTRLETDMRAGMPANDLAARHGPDLAFPCTELLAQNLELFRKARLGPYRDVILSEAKDLGSRRDSSLRLE